MATNATITQIAKLAQVSRATASLALRGSPKVAETVRHRVRSAATQLDYRPNPLVSAHMAYVRTTRPPPAGQKLAFVSHLSEEAMKMRTRMPHQVYLRAAQLRAQALGYVLESYRLPRGRAAALRLSGLLRERDVTGIIVPPLNERAALQTLDMDLRPFAAVMIEHAFMEPRLHKVCADQLSTIARLIQRMLDYGYARIGIALPSHMDDHANHSWMAGYCTFQEFCPGPNRVPHLITPHWTKDCFLAWYRRWLPEAIITIDSDIVLWLTESGAKVPEQVGCATLSWTDCDPTMSGYYQNWETLGTEAVNLVVSQLFRNERGLPDAQRTLLVGPLWREGSTLSRRSALDTRAALRVWNR